MDGKTKQLEALLREAKRFLEGGETYAAVKRLAEIFSWSSHQRNPNASAWTQRVLALMPADEGVGDSVVEGISRDHRKLQYVLSTGGQYDRDEILLIITLRIQLAELLHYLLNIYGIDPKLDLKLIDREIEDIASSRSQAANFHSEYRRVVQRDSLLCNAGWVQDVFPYLKFDTGNG